MEGAAKGTGVFKFHLYIGQVNARYGDTNLARKIFVRQEPPALLAGSLIPLTHSDAGNYSVIHAFDRFHGAVAPTPFEAPRLNLGGNGLQHA